MLLPPLRSCSLIIRKAALDVSRRPHKVFIQQQRSKRTSSIGKEARQAISNNSNRKSPGSGGGVGVDAATIEAQMVGDNIFGMRPIDYSILPPIRASPPPPPSKPGLQKYIAPASMVFAAAAVAYFYVNNKNDNFEYWAAMQSGTAVEMDDDDDDDEYEDDDGEEEEEEE